MGEEETSGPPEFLLSRHILPSTTASSVVVAFAFFLAKAVARDTHSQLGDWASPCGLHCSLFSLQSSVCAKIVQLLGQNEVDYRQKQVVILSQDSFYRALTSEQTPPDRDRRGDSPAWSGRGSRPSRRTSG